MQISKQVRLIAIGLVLALGLAFGATTPALAQTQTGPAAPVMFSTTSAPELRTAFRLVMDIPDSALQSNEALTKWKHSAQGRSILAQIHNQNTTDLSGVSTRSAWGCAAALGTALLGVAVPAVKLLRIKKLIKELGGVWNAAKLLAGAGTAHEKGEAIVTALAALVAEITGIKGMKENCL